MVQTSGKEEKMTTAYDVPANVLINRLSGYMKVCKDWEPR